ncbi:TrmH family RNA methyltransferase [Streptosporangium lutulentum]|uniref:tRNA G18 (Ribose-2'-O)-methylase SpoU n=1 Tax=Streptosporangium lutulentum TaxID=1461250 RepID=A0ABT9QT86_9ACTN|nr:RNA methyltransferase [Streptosporangium lutulentum]MDP9849928.1 tRNA G18 (ribose-2'-O)-methylase SpoU [Streptosporangium lutulentum]
MSNLSDPRLADYANLRDVELRKSLEAEHGLFIAEGEKVIRRAVAAGYPVRSVLLTRRWAEPLADLLGELGDRVHVVDDAVVEDITGFPVHRGALAAMERLPLPTVEQVLAGRVPASDDPAVRIQAPEGSSGRVPASGDPAFGDPAGWDVPSPEDLSGHVDAERAEPHAEPPRRVLILEDLVDHGNVGAIFRCAAALGVEAVILSPRCADPLYRRSVKVSMGAVFAIPYARMTDWYGGLAELRGAGFQTLALTPDQSAVPLDEVAMADRVALLLGSEGDGLSSRWLREADEAVCIPMSPVAMGLGVDSLNVVAAAAIACHGLMRGRPADGSRQRG